MAVRATGFIGTSGSTVLFFSTNVEHLFTTGNVPDESHPAYLGKLERGKAFTSLWRAAKGQGSHPSLQAAMAVKGGTFREQQMSVVLHECQLAERQTQTQLTLETYCTGKRYARNLATNIQLSSSHVETQQSVAQNVAFIFSRPSLHQHVHARLLLGMGFSSSSLPPPAG
jgi:hypothetical protein